MAADEPGHAIYWGIRSDLATGGMHWTGSACGLATGPATFDAATPPVDSVLYFVVVGRNASWEGSYGRSVTGVEWPDSSGLGACDLPRILANSCAP
jgi:hypothetical protein